MATTTQETGRHSRSTDIRVPDNVRDARPRARQGARRLDRAAGHARPASSSATTATASSSSPAFTASPPPGRSAWPTVPVVIRDAQTEDADRAVENITRKQLNPYEEAKAVRAMLERGLTEDGAAQALGWPKQRVTARVKILELPERAQQLIGEGVIHLAAVDQLRAIGTVAPDLLDAVIAYLDDGNAWAAERLTREPGWVLDAALTHAGDSKVFAAYLHSASAHEIAELRLGKKTEQLYARGREAAQAARPLRLRPAAGPLHRRRTSTRRAPPAC